MAVFHAGFASGETPVRVRFGVGARYDLAPEMAALHIRKALVLTTRRGRAHGEEMVSALGDAAAGMFDGAVMHTPVEVMQTALEMLRSSGADGMIAIGGGSTIGLSKALAWRTGLPQIVLPTTYAGSEATHVLGQTENGVKSTLALPKVQPGAVIYDPELVASLPVAMTVTSGLNAIAHAVEGLYARDRSRLSSALAEDGLRTFVYGLPGVIGAPTDLAAREDTLFGAWLCGTVLAQVGMALHHKLCHTLGGTLGLPHSETHAILLPHTGAFNERVAATDLAPVAAMLGAESSGGGLYDFAVRLGGPVALRDLGMAEADLDRMADRAVANPYWNPRPIERGVIRALLARAWAGDRPGKED